MGWMRTRTRKGGREGSGGRGISSRGGDGDGKGGRNHHLHDGEDEEQSRREGCFGRCGGCVRG
jgi:hypothetical protein